MSFLNPLLYGPTGRSLSIDASGRLVVNADTAADAYVLGYGSTGHHIVVDGSGRLLLSALSQGLGAVQGATNLGTGSGLFKQLNGSNLEFYSLKPGTNVSIEEIGGLPGEYRISAITGSGASIDANTVAIIDASGFYVTDNVEAALTLLAELTHFEHNTGFIGWLAPIDAEYYTIAASGFTVLNAGEGAIHGKKVTWAGGQSVGPISSGQTHYIYMDDSGTIGETTTISATLYYDNIVLFEAHYDGTNFTVVKENHPYSMNTATSIYLHNNVGTVIRGEGAAISRVSTGTGAASGDRQIKIDTGDSLEDHGLVTTIPVTNPISWEIYYKLGTAKWKKYSTASELPMVYNNAGTMTALTNKLFAVVTLYAIKDDLKSSNPRFIAVYDSTEYGNIGTAEDAINNNTIDRTSAELSRIEPTQLGYAILKNETGGYINELIVAKSTFNSRVAGGGNQGDASLVVLDTGSFGGILSSADANVQAAMETIDDHDHQVTTDFANASGNISGNLIVENTLLAASGYFTNGIQVGSGSLHFRPDGSIVAPNFVINADGTSTAVVSTSTNFTNASGIFIKNGENIGSGVNIFSAKDVNGNLQFYSLISGSGIVVSASGSTIRFDSTSVAGGGTVQGATNLGSASGLYVQLNGTNLEFKSISAGTNISLSGSATELRISSTGGSAGTVAVYDTGTRSVANGSTDQHTVVSPGVGSAVQEGFIGRITLSDLSSLAAGDVTVKIYNDFARAQVVYERVFDLAQTPLVDYLPAYFISASGGAMYFDIVNNTGSSGNFSVETRVSTVLSVSANQAAAGSGVTSESAGDGLSYSSPRLDIDLASNPGLELTGASPNKQLRVKAGDGITLDATGANVDSTVVRTTGNQNIAGVKRFSDHAFGITPHPSAGPPTSGTYTPGDFFMDSNKHVYMCSSGGTPGAWQLWGWSYTQGISIDESAGQENANYTGTVAQGTSSGIAINTGISSAADGGRRGVIRKLHVWVSTPSHASGTLDIPFRVQAYPNEKEYGREQLWSILGQGRKVSLTGDYTGGVDNVLKLDNVNKMAVDDLVRIRRSAATVGEEYARITSRSAFAQTFTLDEAIINDVNKGDAFMAVVEFVELPWVNNSAIADNRDKIYLRFYNDGENPAVFGYQLDIENIGGGPSIT